MDTIRSQSLISTLDAAQRVGCSVQHLRLLIRTGSLKATRIGRDWLLEESAVDAFVSMRYAPSMPKPMEVREPIETLFPEHELQAVVNVASVPKRSPFRYPGGKTWLIPYARLWLKSISPKPTALVEPFAGGGTIGLTAGFEGLADRVRMIELDPDIAAVWKVSLNGNAEELCRLILQFSCEEAEVCQVLRTAPSAELDRAFQTIVRNRVSRGGILAPGAGLVKAGEAGKGLRSRWYPETICTRIRDIHARREIFSFTEGDGFAAISASQTNESLAFFIDPPYTAAGRRLYRHHHIDHRKLFELMAEVQGQFLITYDDSDEIRSLAEEFRLDHELVPMKSTHHQRKYELLISKDLDWVPSRAAR